MLHLYPEALPQSQRDERTQGSHNNLINAVGAKMRAKDQAASATFNNEIQKLKRLRVKADYEDTMFDAALSRDAQRLASGIVKLLQRILGQ